jgi:hypothetical protein
VSNISDPDSLMTADFSVSLASGTGTEVRPESFSARNYPNPFNAATRIEVRQSTPGAIAVEIYQLLGGLVRRWTSPFEPAGTWHVTWDGRDQQGMQLGSGVYWYRVSAGESVVSGKMVMLK